MYRVFVTRRLPGQALERLKDICQVTVFPEDRNMTKQELLAVIPEQDAIITMLANPLDAEVIGAGQRLKVIANYAVGFNNIDLAAATAQGIAVVNTPDVLTDATADFAWALLLAAARRLVEGDALVRAGRFQGWAPELLLGVEVHGKTLGIIGAGRIGQAVARRALGFGMRLMYYNRTRLPEKVERDLNLEYADLKRSCKRPISSPFTAPSHPRPGT